LPLPWPSWAGGSNGWGPTPSTVVLLLSLGLSAWLYRRGHRNQSVPVRRHLGATHASAGHGLRLRRQNRRFLAAGVMLAVTLGPPLEHLAHALASAHMAQHLLLVMVVAPLLAAARPAPRMLRGLPAGLRGAAHALQRVTARCRLSTDRRVALWTTLAALVIVFWHVRWAYQAALTNPLVHAGQHLTLLGAGVGWWGATLQAGRGTARHVGWAIPACFVLSLLTALLGVLLTFATAPWYRYPPRDLPFGWSTPDPVADQQVAGLLMWVPMGMGFLAMALWLLAAILNQTPAPNPADGDVSADSETPGPKSLDLT